LELAGQLGNASQACKMRGCSRNSFCRFEEAYDKGGELALQEISRHRPILKNRVPPEIEPAVMKMAIEQPAGSPDAAGVRCVWQRHDLSAMKLRLRAREARAARDDTLLTEEQITALESTEWQ